MYITNNRNMCVYLVSNAMYDLNNNKMNTINSLSNIILV